MEQQVTDPEQQRQNSEVRGARERDDLSVALGTTAREHAQAGPAVRESVFRLADVGVRYNSKPAVEGVTVDVLKNDITAFIGPSGCGKSTLLRCLNRMNDLIPGATVSGDVLYHGENLYAPKVDAVEVRKRIGMVFQKPNPFPKSIYDNVAFGPKVLGLKGDMDHLVEHALRRAAVWDDVKDRLKDNAFGMSGGQQQRLCIARCLAVEPDVLLMDEPCSALDPISTGKIEELMLDLKEQISIVVVTHNMQQAARVSDRTAFFNVELTAGETNRVGRLVELAATEKIFTTPEKRETEDYITGRFG
jgi:phosphate transport system ATP-binding protein